MKTDYTITFSADNLLLPHVKKALSKLGIKDAVYKTEKELVYDPDCKMDAALSWLDRHASQSFVRWVNGLPTQLPGFTKNSEYMLWTRISNDSIKKNLLREMTMEAITAGRHEEPDNPFMVAVWLCYKAKNPEGSPVPHGREEEFSMSMITSLISECEEKNKEQVAS